MHDQPKPESMRRFEELDAELNDRALQLAALPADDPNRPELVAQIEALRLRHDEALPCANLVAALGWSFHDAYKEAHAINWETQVQQVPFIRGHAGVANPRALRDDGSIDTDAVVLFQCFKNEDTRTHIHIAFVAALNLVVYNLVPPQFWDGESDPTLS